MSMGLQRAICPPVVPYRFTGVGIFPVGGNIYSLAGQTSDSQHHPNESRFVVAERPNLAFPCRLEFCRLHAQMRGAVPKRAYPQSVSTTLCVTDAWIAIRGGAAFMLTISEGRCCRCDGRICWGSVCRGSLCGQPKEDLSLLCLPSIGLWRAQRPRRMRHRSL